jgi:Cysteine-rich secretory protein family
VSRTRHGTHGCVRFAAAIALVCAGFSAAPGVAPTIVVESINATVSSASVQLAAPIVGVIATPSGHGYWRVARDGGVLTAGDATFYGSAAGKPHDAIVAMAITPTGRGYWLVDRKGAIFHFGNAPARGSMAGRPLSHPIVGMAATPDGQGYWLVASDGGVFAFHAPFRGSTGNIRLNQPIVGMAATPDGSGYWLVASDGGIFAFHAPFRGSTGNIRLNKPIVGMAAAPSGSAYTMVASDGGVFRFGSLPFYGSAIGACPGGPAIGVTMSPGANGYWIGFSDARTYAFSPSTTAPKCGPTGTTKSALAAADLFKRLNAERAARGLPALTWDPSLAIYATSWSKNMASYGFRHSNIGSLLGSYNFVGENIAMGSAGVTAGSLHNAWMHSDGHRANILAPGFMRVGVGVYCRSDGSLWATQDFARPATAGSPPPPPPTPPVNPIARPDAGTSHC